MHATKEVKRELSDAVQISCPRGAYIPVFERRRLCGMMRRFKDRPKCIARRTEREKFERSVMPAAYICLPLAVAVFIAAALSYLIYGEAPREILVLGAAIVAIPLVLLVFRFVRGHFSSSLDEP